MNQPVEWNVTQKVLNAAQVVSIYSSEFCQSFKGSKAPEN